MSPERERFIRGWMKQAREERRQTVRPVLVQGRRNEADVDVTQLPTRETINMRDPVTGEMFFVLDYSLVDGPDVIAP